MKHFSKFLKGIRAAFVGFSVLFALSIFGLLVQLVVIPDNLTARVGVTTVSGASAPAPTAPAAGDARVEGLRADVVVPLGKQGPAELKRITRLAIIPSLLVIAISGLVLCQLVQRLFGNLESGELFAAQNLRLLRTIGIVLVVATVLERIVGDLGRHFFGEYAASHVTVAGAKILPIVDRLGISGVALEVGRVDFAVAGLLLLVMVRAFQEGLALKRESELTV